ncbi:Hypothetical predicted protein [Paramuricea clavata]|uniref:Uncharacterized protein n=1 Tax=Paramuricea clavata TaxID=317549 RepID=A0A7D9HQJ6_PARCT|nr:Hypothetical predicted protein [Paramuricea clavata]
MHEELDYVLYVEVVGVRHAQLKSVVMEKDGCEWAMDFLMQKLSVQEFVTDASSQLIKMLATDKKYENVAHQLDIWHKSNKYEGLKAHSILAAIDHNHHLHRKQARNSKGELVYSRRWSKRAKRWKVVIVKEKKNFSYLPFMTARVLKEASKTWNKHVMPVQSAQDPKNVARTIASLPPPPTSELVKEHISRY